MPILTSTGQHKTVEKENLRNIYIIKTNNEPNSTQYYYTNAHPAVRSILFALLKISFVTKIAIHCNVVIKMQDMLAV